MSPQPVIAPVKFPKKSATTTSSEVVNPEQEKQKVGKDETQTDTDDSKQQGPERSKIVHMEFSVSAEPGTGTIQRFKLNKGEDEIMSTKVTNFKGVNAGEINFSLGDVVGQTKINTSNIHVNVSKEKIVIEIKDAAD